MQPARSSEAEDAFGVTIGRETLGLYTASSVRGFSPTAAGNARIDGFYFDQVWALNSRLRRTTTIRVGPSALSHPFPAPTGIVDQAFKTTDSERSVSLLHDQRLDLKRQAVGMPIRSARPSHEPQPFVHLHLCA